MCGGQGKSKDREREREECEKEGFIDSDKTDPK